MGTNCNQGSLTGHRSGHGPGHLAYRDPNGTKNQLMCVHRGITGD
ncbi:hypothetical protein ABT033_28025 [Streptomyces pharetrae]